LADATLAAELIRAIHPSSANSMFSFDSVGGVGSDELLPHRHHCRGGLGSGALDEVRQRSLAERADKEIGKEFGSPHAGDHLTHVKVDCCGLEALDVLDRLVHAGRKAGSNRGVAVPANSALRAFLDDVNSDGGKFEDLSPRTIPGMTRPGDFTENLPAVRAACPGTETVFDGPVGLSAGLSVSPTRPSCPHGVRPDFSRRLPGLGGGGSFRDPTKAGDCCCRRRPRCVTFEFAQSRLESLDSIPQHQDQIGNDLWVALGKSDERFASGPFGKHEEHPSLK
jgi:hypothetical protein